MEKIWLVNKLKRIRLIYYIQTFITLSIFSIILFKSIQSSNDSNIMLFLIFYSIVIISFIASHLLWIKMFFNINLENYTLVLKYFKILSKVTLVSSSVFIGYGVMQSHFNINGEFTYKNNDIEVLINRISKISNEQIKLDKEKLYLVLKALKTATILHIVNYFIWFILFGLYIILIFNNNYENLWILTFLYYLPLYFPADIYYSSGIILEIWKDIKRDSYNLFLHNFITHFDNHILLGSIMGFSRIQPKFLNKARKILLEELINKTNTLE